MFAALPNYLDSSDDTDLNVLTAWPCRGVSFPK